MAIHPNTNNAFAPPKFKIEVQFSGRGEAKTNT